MAIARWSTPNAFMTAYNSWGGTPMIENRLLRDVVMKV